MVIPLNRRRQFWTGQLTALLVLKLVLSTLVGWGGMSAFTRFQEVVIRACGDNVVYLSIAVGVLPIITTLPSTILPFHQDLQISFHFLILIFQVLSHLFQYCLVHHHLVLRILMHGHHVHSTRKRRV